MIPKLTCICAFVSCVLAAAASQAATIALPANGNLQAAINSALPGDVITLPAGAIYVGNFVLPAKTNPNGLPITIKSGGESRHAPGSRSAHPAGACRPAAEDKIAECRTRAADGSERAILDPAISRIPGDRPRIRRHHHVRLRRSCGAERRHAGSSRPDHRSLLHPRRSDLRTEAWHRSEQRQDRHHRFVRLRHQGDRNRDAGDRRMEWTRPLPNSEQLPGRRGHQFSHRRSRPGHCQIS